MSFADIAKKLEARIIRDGRVTTNDAWELVKKDFEGLEIPKLPARSNDQSDLVHAIKYSRIAEFQKFEFKQGRKGGIVLAGDHINDVKVIEPGISAIEEKTKIAIVSSAKNEDVQNDGYVPSNHPSDLRNQEIVEILKEEQIPPSEESFLKIAGNKWIFPWMESLSKSKRSFNNELLIRFPNQTDVFTKFTLPKNHTIESTIYLIKEVLLGEEVSFEEESNVRFDGKLFRVSETNVQILDRFLLYFEFFTSKSNE